ncbi:MAG: hypothetical protein HC880_04545, partial [Bacteroidia bacterium]|nr:hypothetical protein [Bacteroidia bacterium]
MGKPEKLSYLIMRGHLFREQNDFVETAKSLGSAVKIMSGGERKARLHFILGQIYQKYDRAPQAYRQYKKVFKNNPPYELAFNARLYMVQVSNLKDQDNVKRIHRSFKKMLNDTKNKEYQDKIYYEMALFELRRENTIQAVSLLRQSLALSVSNPIQKAYSYLKLGEIYYGVPAIRDYEQAKTYYDSSIVSLPTDIEGYDKIKKRQENLSEFIEQLRIYQVEDSLQKLARMEEPRRSDYIKYLLTHVETKRQDELDSIAEVERKRQALLKETQDQGADAFANQGGNGWYFYNPTSINNGVQEFRKRWGPRPLVDNWRRASAIRNIPINRDSVERALVVKPEEIRQQSIKKRVEDRAKEIYEALPETEEDFIASSQKIEESA